MSNATHGAFRKDAWQNPRNVRTLRAYMALKNQEIAERVVALRKGRHMSQKAVYETLGVSERAYQNWESGDTKPNYTSLQKLAEFFGVSEGYILEGVDDRPVIEGVPEQLDTVDEKFTDLVMDVQAQLGQINERLDRLMHMVDQGLFTPRPPREDEGSREDQVGLGAALAQVFLSNPEALRALREQLRPSQDTPRSAGEQGTRPGA